MIQIRKYQGIRPVSAAAGKNITSAAGSCTEYKYNMTMRSASKKITKTKKAASPRITKKEGLDLLKNADLLGLGMMADEMRTALHPHNSVSFIIDRNINYTNVCINKCKFCAFYRNEGDKDAAMRLFYEASEIIPGDPYLEQFLASIASPVSLDSDPPGATVSVKGYNAPDRTWIRLGEAAESVGFMWERSMR